MEAVTENITTEISPTPADATHPSGLRHSLRQRHMTMIALGGVIGAGLFVGSGVVIKSAGPAAVLSFVITGLLVVLVMRMLAELAVALPAVGSFYEYARLAWGDRPLLGELAGFLTGWMYWYFWVIVVALEAIAGAGLIRFWLPGAPGWLISLVLLVLLTVTNLISVRSYGEFEFWFASIKVAAITVFLAVAGAYVFGLWPGGSVHLDLLNTNGGFAPNGILPILTGAVAATGFYFGAEIVTIAAAEAAEPAKAVARATNSVISRALIFYVGSILLVVCLVPWNSPAISTPYVSALSALGVPAAAQIMNAVVLTAVLSALNSGLYASSRMLFALTRRGDAPQGLTKLSRSGVPTRAILLGTLFGYAAVIMSYVSPDTVFAFLVNSYGTVALFVYVLIAFSQLRLRARLEREDPARLAIRMWAYPYLTYLAIAGMLAILLAMAFIPEQRTPLIFGVASLAILLVAFGVRTRFGGRQSAAAGTTTPQADSPQLS
jgi:GABA permease